jgi:hypothetical protein
LKKKLIALEKRQRDLRQAIATATAPSPLIHPNLAMVDRDRVAALRKALADPETRPEAFDAIRSLID